MLELIKKKLMNTGKITFLFRKLGCMHFLDKMKFYFYFFKNYKKNKAFTKKYPSLKFPPNYMMFESFQLDYEKYYFGGETTAKYIINNIAKHTSLENKKILDWGCGPARVIRHLPSLLPESTAVYGTDYNKDTIAWCKKHIEKISFENNEINPPLVFASDFFDVIYGISIFTHLSEENHYAWLEELLRVAKSGAVLLFTTHGEAFKPIMTEAEKEAFEEGNLLIRDNVKEGHRVYAAFHPLSFMKNMFQVSCEIIEHIPGKQESWGFSQDVWIVKKK